MNINYTLSQVRLLLLSVGAYIFTILAIFTTAVLIIAANKDKDADLLLLSLSVALNASLSVLCVSAYSKFKKE